MSVMLCCRCRWSDGLKPRSRCQASCGCCNQSSFVQLDLDDARCSWTDTQGHDAIDETSSRHEGDMLTPASILFSHEYCIGLPLLVLHRYDMVARISTAGPLGDVQPCIPGERYV